MVVFKVCWRVCAQRVRVAEPREDVREDAAPGHRAHVPRLTGQRARRQVAARVHRARAGAARGARGAPRAPDRLRCELRGLTLCLS